MKRLLLLSFVCLAAAATIGCGSGRQFGSGCRLFSGFRGAPCDVCAPNPCACPSPCGTPVYTQSIPAYGGDCGCSSFPGYPGVSSYGAMGGFGGYDMSGGYAASGGCSSCNGGGMQYTPGMIIPGQGMVIDGGQIPSLPGGLSPQTVPAPQQTPIPQATPGPAAGN